jgi:hypothetical protein
MKKVFFFSALLAFTTGFAQDKTTTTVTSTMTSTRDKALTLSVYGSFIDLNQVGLSLEFLGSSDTSTMNSKTHSWYSSKVVDAAYGMMRYEAGGGHTDGNGFVVDLGSRMYFGTANSALYFANYLSYGNIKFTENGADGTYSYFSFFSPELGYKIKAGNFAIDPFAGIMWKLEIKGQGGIDNKNVNEWTPRVGIKLGYQF